MKIDATTSTHRRRIAAALGTFAILTAAQVMTAGPAAAAATLTVSPATGLADGQTVTVSGTGFSPNASDINVVQCPASNPSADACYLGGGKFFQHADAAGAFTMSMTVKAVFGSTDCTKVVCMIVARAGTDPNSGATAQQNLRFGAAPTAAGTVRASTPASRAAATTTAARAGTAAATGPASTSVVPSQAVGGVSTSAAPGALAPTAANTGQALVPHRPWRSEVLAACALLLLAAGVVTHRRAAAGQRRSAQVCELPANGNGSSE